MERKPFTRSEFDEHEEWEEDELKEHPDRANDELEIDNTSMGILEQVRERNLKKLREEGIGHSKNPKKLDT